MTTIGFAHDYATTGGQHNTAHTGQFIDHLLFTLAKASLPFHVKNPGNVGATALFDNLIGIVKVEIHFGRQHAANAAFTSAHWPYQKDRRCSHHRSAVSERVLHQSWSDKHQQFALVISTVGVTEQCTNQRQITKERRFADGNNFFRTENTTQYHGFAVIH